jgi:EAL domain-containing protein (putative c-di-GMP-specific phosphodiesterase class I)
LSYNVRRALAAEIDHIVWYQPIVAAASGRPVGAEALARAYTSDGRVVSAGALFSDARCSHERLRRLDRQTVRRVGASVAEWAAIDFFPSISLNVSTTTIDRDPAAVLRWLADEKIDPKRITVEITETAPVEDIAAVATAVEQYRTAGLRVAIDDFGCGSATFELLHRVGADIMKIDRRFVRSLIADDRSRRVVAAMVRLAHELGMQVVAEGVESALQWNWLTEIGCDAVQGHAIARPMPPDSLVFWRDRLAWSPIIREGTQS